MGLDMYLTAHRYISAWQDEEKTLAEKIEPLFPELNGLRIKGIDVEAMYWRKSNQIHNWFVKNCQDGEDKCQEVDVSRDDLQLLIFTCEQVLADHSKAVELLPPAAGFFFGGTDIDDYYYEDLQATVDGLKKALLLPESEWYFNYRSSW